MKNRKQAERTVIGMGQNLRLNCTAHLMQRLLLTAFFILAVSALAVGISQGERYLQAFALALLGLFLYTALCVPAAKRLEHLGPLRLWLLLTILCVAIKVFWIWRVRVPLAGDYSVFWGYANALSERTTVYGGRYMALFPHIFGYADFLSWFIRLSGPQPMLAPVLNVLLTVCSGSFLYHLCLRWFHLPAATLVYLPWTLCPSQTIYNSLVLSEPLYTALILGVLSLLTETERFAALKGYPLWMGVLSGTAGGVLLRWVNGVRPIAAILLIALLLWLSLLNLNRLAARNWRRWWGLCMAGVLGAYVLLGPVWNARLSVRIGEEPSHTPGYSLLVGFNPNSGGRWNQEDSDRLYGYSDQPGATAQWTQEQLLADAEARILSGEIDFSKLLKQKLRTFLGSDDACVGYSASVLRHTEFFSLLCNGFYYAAFLLAIGGAVQVWRSRERGLLLLAPLYILGLTLAQMLVEVAGRYHYSMIPMLLLLGQGTWRRAGEE